MAVSSQTFQTAEMASTSKPSQIPTKTSTSTLSKKKIESVDTNELYDRWAKTYDKDSNMLQQIDDHHISALLQDGFQLTRPSMTATVTELGCGTGRNTYKLLTKHPSWPTITHLNALDLSPAMLQLAQEKCGKLCGPEGPKLHFHQFDALAASVPPVGLVDMVVSTLVLEHLPIATFFATIKKFLRPGGAAVVTNMHSEMGVSSRAGFHDEEMGVKVRGVSYAHTIDEVLDGARKEGFSLYGIVEEKAVTEEDLERGIVGDRGKKWLGTNVWFGCVFELEK